MNSCEQPTATFAWQLCKSLAHLVLLNAAHLELFSVLISNQSEGINKTFTMGKPIRHGKR